MRIQVRFQNPSPPLKISGYAPGRGTWKTQFLGHVYFFHQLFYERQKIDHFNFVLLHLEDIAFSASSGNIVGYVDFDDEAITAMSHSTDSVATHMLAFFLRGKLFALFHLTALYSIRVL